MNTKAIVCALLATLCYTGDTVITDAKLTKVNTWVVTFLMGVVAIIVSSTVLMYQRTTEKEIVMPDRGQYGWLLAFLLLSYGADVFHFKAMQYQIGAVPLCLAYALMPVLASVYESFYKGHTPDLRSACAWIFGTIALWLIMTKPNTT